ncbi:MAG: hypothetical protein NXI23_17600, partial [Bacteroidetes bacterium]|nr:hypothetical protein [Bacteroidota bacterium]
RFWILVRQKYFLRSPLYLLAQASAGCRVSASIFNAAKVQKIHRQMSDLFFRRYLESKQKTTFLVPYQEASY